MTRSLIIIAHDIRSAHNVGALLRTADGLGIATIYFTGYTPYPLGATPDTRLPHIAAKLDAQISKTALGAQDTVPWLYQENIHDVITDLKQQGYCIAGLEQTATSIPLPTYQAPAQLAILLGTEVTGIPEELLKLVDQTLEIPMVGAKESFNVVEAASMAMYHCQLISPQLP